MLPVTLDAFRLFIHVTAAAVWVGGQIVLAGLVPALRPAGRDTVVAAARRFQRLAWPAFAVVVLTGLWNLDAAHYTHQPDQWRTTVMVKMGTVALAGVCAAAHTKVAGAAARGATAGAALLGSLLALFWGVQLGG